MRNADLYRSWIEARGLAEAPSVEKRRGKDVVVHVEAPDEQGLFKRGTLRCVLPYLRVYWKAEADDAPPWQPETWQPLTWDEWDEKKGRTVTCDGEGFVRFLRADQLLQCVNDLLGCGDDLEELVKVVRSGTATWLVPVDEPLRDHVEVLGRRVETVRLLRQGDRWRWSRNVSYFPDGLRFSVPPGLDPIHTPENARAGLTRYLCDGWTIDDEGRLVADVDSKRSTWGPSSSRVHFREHDAPRRLMLGASLQSRGVPLIESERPRRPADEEKWLPPGRRLRASFTTLGGWTHEDAVVLSESAAEKLGRRAKKPVRVIVPSTAARVDLPFAEGAHVEHGQILVRAFIDAFALGLRRHAAEEHGAVDGWVEVALPGAFAPFGGTIRRVTRQALRMARWRELITFEIERPAPLGVGDKLSTRHGIKGVVSRILPDDEMPPTPEGPAEIVISPLGIVRRGAMGQLKEAAPDGTEVPRTGTIFVMRQPQDAGVPERCRVRGSERGWEHVHKHLHPGQRYGEMEFWALMAHGASAIARELLSVERNTASWVEWERKIDDANQRKLATRALNRYLAVTGVQIHKGRLTEGREPPGVFGLEPPMYDRLRSARDDRKVAAAVAKVAAEAFLDKLDDPGFFCEQGGLGRLPLGRVMRVVVGVKADEIPLAFERNDDDEGRYKLGLPLGRPVAVVRRKLGGRKSELVVDLDDGGQPRAEPNHKVVGFVLDIDHLYVLPPWLRPSSAAERHPLTRAYWRLLTKMTAVGKDGTPQSVEWRGQMKAPVDALVGDCVRLTLDDKVGAGGFLRREVLGRRLTRSARAVIVPRPDLRIDQIAIPQWMADRLFEGLPKANRRLVLVNRNPTLHRGGLLALRPVIDPSNGPHVFGLPLGILVAMGADFDGDQASVIALETEAALAEAERLLPGAPGLRNDPLRSGKPAFPFAGELSDPKAEQTLADDADSSQDEWCESHHAIQQRLIEKLGDGWGPRIDSALAKHINPEFKPPLTNHDLWRGIDPYVWRDLATIEMAKVLRGVRRKGKLGGVLRRELYRRAFTDDASFSRSVQALQAVTERMTQTALSVKSGAGATGFKSREYFDDPGAGAGLLADLDASAGRTSTDPLDHAALAEALSSKDGSVDNGANERNEQQVAIRAGLLEWIASPRTVPRPHPAGRATADPRVSWFLA